MREENKCGFIGVVMGLILGVVAGLILGWSNGRHEFMREAVKHGVAEWRVADHTGRVTFTWIYPK